VELIARFVVLKRHKAPAQRADAVIYELPLQRWVDVPGSKLGLLSAVRMGFELLAIYHAYFVRRWQPTAVMTRVATDAACGGGAAARGRGASPRPRPRAKR
jgi:hypothetical protein